MYSTPFYSTLEQCWPEPLMKLIRDKCINPQKTIEPFGIGMYNPGKNHAIHVIMESIGYTFCASTHPISARIANGTNRRAHWHESGSVAAGSSKGSDTVLTRAVPLFVAAVFAAQVGIDVPQSSGTVVLWAEIILSSGTGKMTNRFPVFRPVANVAEGQSRIWVVIGCRSHDAEEGGVCKISACVNSTWDT